MSNDRLTPDKRTTHGSTNAHPRTTKVQQTLNADWLTNGTYERRVTTHDERTAGPRPSIVTYLEGRGRTHIKHEERTRNIHCRVVRWRVQFALQTWITTEFHSLLVPGFILFIIITPTMPGKRKMGKGEATKKLPVKKCAGTSTPPPPESSSSEHEDTRSEVSSFVLDYYY